MRVALLSPGDRQRAPSVVTWTSVHALRDRCHFIELPFPSMGFQNWIPNLIIIHSLLPKNAHRIRVSESLRCRVGSFCRSLRGTPVASDRANRTLIQPVASFCTVLLHRTKADIFGHFGGFVLHFWVGGNMRHEDTKETKGHEGRGQVHRRDAETQRREVWLRFASYSLSPVLGGEGWGEGPRTRLALHRKQSS
jgi:hypothetical protein